MKIAYEASNRLAHRACSTSARAFSASALAARLSLPAATHWPTTVPTPRAPTDDATVPRSTTGRC
jgi:hypothetical protein